MDERERMLRLSDQSAACAYAALGSFLECCFRDQARAVVWQEHALDALRQTPTSEVVGLFADLSGGPCSKLGWLLDRPTATQLVHPLVRRLSNRPREWMECSALLEAANVAFSAGVSTLGDALDGVVFPSVPRIWGESTPQFREEFTRSGEAEPCVVFARGDTEDFEDLGMCLVWFAARRE